ncbi:DegT/DnrJ/EryC1/StrS family aminotransferase [Haloferula sp.]|uniref:DegT/DnrJ/EryC1/StrS family aminotransferase n=1 Tax=Haloferula sp. TaxID=2497595 RepID=UPI003C7275FF
MKVPFFSLDAHHAPLRDEIVAAIDGVINSGIFAGGPEVDSFEESFAKSCGTRFAAGVGSGTDALWLVLEALGIGPGDEVVTVPMTFVATVEAICRTGAKPVFVDISEDRFTMDPSGLEAVLTSRTKAIIPVHLFGQMAEMRPILQIAEAYGIPVIEDAAQAHGAAYKDRPAGSHGLAGCFSFYPGKNLGALGEAGAVVTNDPDLDAKVRLLREHGQRRKYEHEAIGWNCRMDAIQAAVLKVKLPNLTRYNERRRIHAQHYSEALSDFPDLQLPSVRDPEEHVHHIYAVRCSQRDNLIMHFASMGIGYGIHYPVPIHLQPAYAKFSNGRGSFPVAEACATSFVSLPVYPELSASSIQAVVQSLEEFCSVKLSA